MESKAEHFCSANHLTGFDMLGTFISDIHHERFIMKDSPIIFIAIKNVDT